MDSVFLTAILPPTPGYTYVAKRELVNQPLIHAVLAGLGTLFVERFDAKRSTEDLELMVETLEARKSLLVFPEGTFSREARLETISHWRVSCRRQDPCSCRCGGLAGTRAVLRGEPWLPRHGSVKFEIGVNT